MATDYTQHAAESGLTPDDHLHPVSSTIANEFKSFVADVEEFLQASAMLSSAELANAKAQIAARVATAKTKLGSAGHTVSVRARQAANATDTYVHAEPWKAVGIGVASGFLIGWLIGRKD